MKKLARLSLNRETVRELSPEQSLEVGGGATTSALCPTFWSDAQPHFCALTPVRDLLTL